MGDLPTNGYSQVECTCGDSFDSYTEYTQHVSQSHPQTQD